MSAAVEGIPKSGRVIGFDLGAVRIGVAISDAGQTMASGLAVLARTADPRATHATMAAMVAGEAAVGVVVGLPLSLDGTIGVAARGALAEVEALRVELGGTALDTIDERFTTVSAHQALRASGRRGRQARVLVDRVAATVLLQSWLDRRRCRQSAPPSQSARLGGSVE